MKRRLPLPSPSMAVAFTALAVALAGTGYAATSLPVNSVGTKQIRNGAVTGPKIAKNAISGAQVKAGTLTTANLASSAKTNWAEVSATGQIIKSSGGITVSHPFTSGYYVHFPTSRLGHGVLTTVVWTGSKDVSSTVICSNNVQGTPCDPPFGTDSHYVYVETDTAAGVRVNRAFYIVTTP